MTVTNTTNSVYYIGNGTNAFYAYGFPVPQLDGFTVTRITRSTGARLDITGACTITGIGGPSGGLVTMPGGAPLAAIYDLEIKRELPLEQTTDFSNQSTVYPETIEAALDYLTMCLIDLANEGDPNALHLNGGVWDAESIRITNVADAVSANDAVNYDQMVTEINAAIAAALSGSGNVPAPTGGETNYVLTATGAGTFDWVAPSGSVADGSITNAKLADMATQRLIGRNSGGAGDPEYVTVTEVLDWVDNTRGTIPSRGASGWTGIDPGTSGYVLTSNGPGADPTYQALPSSSAVPAGTVIQVAMNSAPTGYLKCNGAAVSRATYSDLFTAIGTTFGAGDGSTTFNLPDLRGEWVRGWDDGRGVDSGRVFGSTQSEMIGPHNHTATTTGTFSGTSNTTGAHTHTVPAESGAGAGTGAANSIQTSSSISTSSAGDHSHTVSGSISASTTVNNNSGTENRVRNVALLYCIKT